MRKWLIFALSVSILSTPAVAAWRWVDADGVVHYSDRYVPGAVEVDLPGSETSTLTQQTRSTGTTPAADASASPAPPARPYREFEIVSPAQQQTFWNIGGTLSVELAIDPALQAGHSIDLEVDGQRRELGARSPRLTLEEIFRGTHTVRAVIVDSAGNDVLRTNQVMFMVQQTSLLNPNNPQRSSPNNPPRNLPAN